MSLLSKLFKNTLIILAFLGILNSCGIYKYSDAKKNPTNVYERQKKNLEEGKGFRLSDLNKRGGDFQFATSNPLWRAGIDILSFAPLSNVDYAGGVIVTDWFTDQRNNEQINLNFLFNTSSAASVVYFQPVFNNALAGFIIVSIAIFF